MIAKKKNASAEVSLDSSNLLLFFLKWRVHIVVACFVAAVLAAIASFMIEEKFKSAVSMYAAPQHSIGEQFYEDTKKNDLLQYGEKEDAERLLQILQSDRIRSRVIEKYDLWTHYDISREEPGAYTLMQKEYDSNVSSKMTRNGAIEVTVLDKSNQLASDMANDIAHMVDSVANKLRTDRAKEAFNYVSQALAQVQDEIRVLEDSLGVLYGYGVYEFSEQISGLNEQYATAILQGRSAQAETLRQQMDRLSFYATLFNKLSSLIESAYEREAVLKKRFDLMAIDASSNMPSVFIVDQASPADKKAYPIRWLIVVVSTVAAFVFVVMTILILENYRSLKEEGRL